MLHASTHSGCLLKVLFLKEATYCASLAGINLTWMSFVARSLLSYTTSVPSFAVCSIQSSQIILNKRLSGRRTHKEMAEILLSFRSRRHPFWKDEWLSDHPLARQPGSGLTKKQTREGTHTPPSKTLTPPQECHHGPLGTEKNSCTPRLFKLARCVQERQSI